VADGGDGVSKEWCAWVIRTAAEVQRSPMLRSCLLAADPVGFACVVMQLPYADAADMVRQLQQQQRKKVLRVALEHHATSNADACAALVGELLAVALSVGDGSQSNGPGKRNEEKEGANTAVSASASDPASLWERSMQRWACVYRRGTTLLQGVCDPEHARTRGQLLDILGISEVYLQSEMSQEQEDALHMLVELLLFYPTLVPSAQLHAKVQASASSESPIATALTVLVLPTAKNTKAALDRFLEINRDDGSLFSFCQLCCVRELSQWHEVLALLLARESEAKAPEAVLDDLMSDLTTALTSEEFASVIPDDASVRRVLPFLKRNAVVAAKSLQAQHAAMTTQAASLVLMISTS
jgi:hypothetical protein